MASTVDSVVNAADSPSVAGLLAITDQGVVRARRDADEWAVDASLVGPSVNALAVGPHESGVVFAGTQHAGVQKSTDGGGAWTTSGLGEHPVKSVAVSPHDPETVLVGTKPAGLHVSRDGGGTWAELEGFREIPWRQLWLSPAEPPYYQGPGDRDVPDGPGGRTGRY